MTDVTSVTVMVPMKLRRRSQRKAIIGPDGVPVQMALNAPPTAITAGDPGLVKALARAFRWRRLLEDGRYASLDELAKAEKVDRSHMSRLLRLTLLAPDIVEAILDGRHPEELTLAGLREAVPVQWQEQRLRLGPAEGKAM
jgi:hypothetical protein